MKRGLTATFGPALLCLLLPAEARASGPLEISEVYAHEVNFIEIHNTGETSIDLRGYHLVGDVQHIFSGTSIPSGGYLVLTHSPHALGIEFKAPEIACEQLWGRLHNGGELRLCDPSGELVDWVKYPAIEEGYSLQRRPTTSSYNGPLVWTAAPPTPGRANSVPPFTPSVALDGPTRIPSSPTSDEPALVTVRVYGVPTAVRLAFHTERQEGDIAMKRASIAEGGAAIYTARIRALHGVVRYRITAESAQGERASLEEDPVTGQPLRYAAVARSSGNLPILHLEMAPSALGAVLAGGSATVTVMDTGRSPPAVIEGATLQESSDVERRHRWVKRSLRLRLPHGTDLRGRRDIHLRTSFRDESYLREFLALEVYRRCGVPAPEPRLVRVEVNGDFFGLYTEVEDVDPAFLTRTGFSGAAAFRGSRGHEDRCEGQPLASLEDYQLYWQARSDAPFEALRDFLEGVDACKDDRALESFLKKHLDLERYLRYLASNAIVSDWDTVGHNMHWCFDRRGTQRWFVVPGKAERTWGEPERGHRLVMMQSAVLGTRDRPLHEHREHGRIAWDRVKDRVLSLPSIRARYYEVLAKLTKSALRPDVLAAEIDEKLAAIERDALLDRARWPFAANRRDGRLLEMTFSKRRLRRAADELKIYARDRSIFLARACADAKEPLSREERHRAARRDLLALAALWCGLALYGRFGFTRKAA